MTGFIRPTLGEDEYPGAPRLRPVSRNAPSRPHWGTLYATLAVASLLGATAHIGGAGGIASELVDGALAVVLFGVLLGWLKLNRTALARLDEPGAGVGRPHVRIIRSRPPLRDQPGAATRDNGEPPSAEDRVISPYDFR